MDFLKLSSELEEVLKSKYQYELLEMHYVGYAFGSGFSVFKIKGYLVRVNLDGRDDQIEISCSPKHEKYPNTKWKTIFTGNSSNLIYQGLNKLNEYLV